MDSAHNPSPPPEILEHSQDFHPDRIGDTVFSKHWLFQILLNIIEAVDKVNIEDELKDIHELDSKLEEDACTLWDMSANLDVAHFLHEFKILEIFLEVIEKTKSPRLLEIVIGILGNLASFDDMCQDMSKNEPLLKAIIPLSGSSDAPTVVQVLRLIHAGVVNETAGCVWINVIKADSTFMQNMRFVLENSLNGEVLKGALQLLYYIFDREENTFIEQLGSDFVKCIISAGKQLLILGEMKAVDELWLLLNLLCQHHTIVLAIAEHFEDICSISCDYIKTFPDSESAFLPSMDRVAAIAAHFTTLATLLGSETIRDNNVLKEDKIFMDHLKGMYCAVREVLNNGSAVEEEDKSTPQTNHNNVNSSSLQLEYSRNLQKDDYDSLFILKETLTELCSLLIPSYFMLNDSNS